MLFIFGRTGMFEPNPAFGVVLLVFMLGVLVHSQRKQLRQKRAAWESLRISLDESTLSRHAEGIPDLALPLEEVSGIQEGSLGLTVRGRDRQEVVFIPAGLVDYARVRTRLEGLREIEPSSTSLRVAGSLLIFAGMVATTLAFVFSQSPLVVAPTGALILALVVYSFVELGRSRLVDWRLKRIRWLFIPFAFGILVKMAYALGLWQPGP